MPWASCLARQARRRPPSSYHTGTCSIDAASHPNPLPSCRNLAARKRERRLFHQPGSMRSQNSHCLGPERKLQEADRWSGHGWLGVIPRRCRSWQFITSSNCESRKQATIGYLRRDLKRAETRPSSEQSARLARLFSSLASIVVSEIVVSNLSRRPAGAWTMAYLTDASANRSSGHKSHYTCLSCQSVALSLPLPSVTMPAQEAAGEAGSAMLANRQRKRPAPPFHEREQRIGEDEGADPSHRPSLPAGHVMWRGDARLTGWGGA